MTAEAIDALDLPCECCGATARQGARDMEVTGRSGEPFVALCGVCRGLIKSGLLRAETVDGRKVYRQWHYQPMTPGDLLPRFQS